MKFYLDGFIYKVSNKDYIGIHENIFSIACDETIVFGVFYPSLIWRSIFWRQIVQTHLRFLGLPTSRVEAQNSLNYIYIHPPLLYFVEDCIPWIFMYMLWLRWKEVDSQNATCQNLRCKYITYFPFFFPEPTFLNI